MNTVYTLDDSVTRAFYDLEGMHTISPDITLVIANLIATQMHEGLGNEVPSWQVLQFYSMEERIRVLAGQKASVKLLKYKNWKLYLEGLHSSRKQDRTFFFHFLLFNMQIKRGWMETSTLRMSYICDIFLVPTGNWVCFPSNPNLAFRERKMIIEGSKIFLRP